MNQLRNQARGGDPSLRSRLDRFYFRALPALNGGNVQELRHVSQQHRRDDLRVNAYSALDLAVGVLNEFRMIEGAPYDPAQGWGTL